METFPPENHPARLAVRLATSLSQMWKLSLGNRVWHVGIRGPPGEQIKSGVSIF